MTRRHSDLRAIRPLRIIPARALTEADIKVTRDLIRAGQLLKIEVLDHVIMGLSSPERSQDFVSLRELGYFYT